MCDVPSELSKINGCPKVCKISRIQTICSFQLISKLLCSKRGALSKRTLSRQESSRPGDLHLLASDNRQCCNKAWAAVEGELDVVQTLVIAVYQSLERAGISHGFISMR